MSEDSWPLCVYCRQVVNTEEPHWLTVDRETVDEPKRWIYAHIECQKRAARQRGE